MQPTTIQKKEKENAAKQQTEGEQGQSMAPPAMQLMADPGAGDGFPNLGNGNGAGSFNPIQRQEAPDAGVCEPDNAQSMDYSVIAQNVWDAMFGGTGWGTDEQKVYDNLALLNHDDGMISEFMAFYKARFGTNVDDDIASEFSNNILGNELDQALSYLNTNGDNLGVCPVEDTVGGETDKTTDDPSPALDPDAEAKLKPYVISDGAAWIRNDEFVPLEPKQSIPKWTEVYVSKTGSKDGKNYAFVKGMSDDKEWGWTSTGNLYEQFWDPKDNEDTYKAVSSAYNDQMQAIDPKATRADLIMSGTGVAALANKWYPNETDASKLDSGFKTKVDNLGAFFSANGISYSLNAGLRHPLRSTIFNYAIKVAAASSDDIIHEANAVMVKYGIPIDWAHKNTDGSINRSTSKAKAVEVKGEFGLGSKAARGIKDFGGTISNHNNGKAVDIELTFSFTAPKTVTVGGKSYTINPSAESGNNISGVASKALAQIGKANYGITRAMDDDAVHWSETGH
ncbi:MAG: hypothetical protein H6581_24830 [Bacteroidia bacterium]|nr:hypothetical protein [Bacteroidia bacterium]